jgi:Flp pilus assembly protein TadD
MSDTRSRSFSAADLCADQKRRWLNGEPMRVEAYRTDYPELESDPEGLLDLIYNEVLLREKWGEVPTPEEYVARFPALATQLRDQFEVHQAIADERISTTEFGGKEPTNSAVKYDRFELQTSASDFAISGVRRLTNSSKRYLLKEEIARGGMGIIYRATDTAFGREVAIKVLRDQFASSPAALHRFSNEAQITGQLQHPSIPPAHDFGILPDGRLFLAMKLIWGRTLDALLAERPEPTHEQGRLVAVFEQVCQAIAYAHAHQVIHRDLKPANVMVGNFGEVQVMDWGLAKVLKDREQPSYNPERSGAATVIHSLHDTDGSFTQAGHLLGTPAFMPPEQALGAVDKVDAQSDVFGLGAVLAVILTGLPPFKGASAETTRIMASQGKIDDCYARLDKCGADPDLVALCKQCLAPDKERRPVDAGEVAKAVAELRMAADERARRAELDRVTAESERAAALLTAAEQRKRRRVQLFLAAMILIVLGTTVAFGWYRRDRQGRNAEATTVLLDRCTDALHANNAEKASVALEAAEKRVVEGGAEELTGRMGLLRADLAALIDLDALDEFRLTPVGNLVPDSKKVATRIHEILRRFGADPENEPPDVVQTHVEKSEIRNRLVAALDRLLMMEKSNSVRSALRSIDNDTYREAVRNAIFGEDQGKLTELAQQSTAVDQPPGFVAILGENSMIPVERRRELLKRAILRQPNELGLLMSLGTSYPNNRRERAQERLRWFQAALGVNPAFMSARINLGLAMLDLGDLAGAEAVDREAVRRDPNNPLPHNNLGWVLYCGGDLVGAEEQYQKAIQLDPKFALSHNNLGMLREREGNLAAAESKFREAIQLDPNLVFPHYFLAALAVRRGDLSFAEHEHKEALRLDPTYFWSHNGLGWVLEQKGDLNGAEAAYREASRHEPTFAHAHNNLGRLLAQRDDDEGAEVEYRKAIECDPKLADPHSSLGLLLRQKGDLAGAEAEYRKAIQLDPNDPRTHNNLGSLILHFSGDVESAIASYKEALRIAPRFSIAADNIFRAERMRVLLPRLPGILTGKTAPATPAEACEFATLCGKRFVKRYAAAIRMYEGAFLMDPALANDLTAGYRYIAACLAARAARGEGADSPEDSEARTVLRIKALTWLREDLVLRKKMAVSSNTEERKATAKSLSFWLRGDNFFSLRPGPERIGLAIEECEKWDNLWAEVQATIAEARKPPSPLEIAPPLREWQR